LWDETPAAVPDLQKQTLRGYLPIRGSETCPKELYDQERGSQMIKLYRDALRPKNWVAYVPNTGWVAFPAEENGWEHRAPARGLDPLYLREVPLQTAFPSGLPQSDLLKVA
jgi:hypothetical protein